MVLLSTAIGYALVAAGPLERNLERIAPVLGVLATAFGVWYAAGARGSDLLVLKSDLREPPTGELPRMRLPRTRVNRIGPLNARAVGVGGGAVASGLGTVA
jgi:hypothetical protein